MQSVPIITNRRCEFEPRPGEVYSHTTLCDQVRQFLGTGLWFSPGTPVSSTKKKQQQKTDRHDITEIVLKVL